MRRALRLSCSPCLGFRVNHPRTMAMQNCRDLIPILEWIGIMRGHSVAPEDLRVSGGAAAARWPAAFQRHRPSTATVRQFWRFLAAAAVPPFT
jgi:hypothetical protein